MRPSGRMAAMTCVGQTTNTRPGALGRSSSGALVIGEDKHLGSSDEHLTWELGVRESGCGRRPLFFLW